MARTTKPKDKSKDKKNVHTVPLFGPEWDARTTRGDGKRSSKGQEDLYKNPVQEIVIKPDWYGSAMHDTRDFAIQMLGGYLWACKYDPNIHTVHLERHELERVLWKLTWLKHAEDEQKWVPDEDEQLQLALIDFIRLLPGMWD